MDRKVIMIIPPIEFRDEELFETKEVIEKADIEVKIASTVDTQNKCVGMLKGIVIPDMQLADIQIEDYDAFVFIGGTGTTILWNNSIAFKIVQDAVMLNKITAAISTAPVIFANAGVIKNKRITVWKGEENKMIARGGIYTGNRVEYDGTMITAKGTESAKQFGRSIVKGLWQL